MFTYDLPIIDTYLKNKGNKMKMEKLKIAIDNTSQNSSRTFGEILSADMNGKKALSIEKYAIAYYWSWDSCFFDVFVCI